MTAREDIRNVMYQYARSVDRRDWDGVRSCYHPDAIDDHGGYSGGRDGLIEWMKVRHEAILLSMHFISNVLIDFLESGPARVESYCTTVQQTPVAHASSSLRMYAIAGLEEAKDDDVVETDVRCRFVDLVTERDGEWRIAKRTVVFESLDYRVFTPPLFGPDFVIGARSKEDVLWTVGE
jgi:hypothetical protein